MSDSSNTKKFHENGKELTIRFGLGAIKAVGVGAMSQLVEIRENEGEFEDIYDFASKSGSKILNKKSVEALSKAGAFDNIHKNRNQILQSCEIICKYGASKAEERNSDQMTFFGANSNIKTENPALKNVDDWNKKEKLQKEFEAFGFFVNEHPIDDYFNELKKRGVISSDVLEEDVVKDSCIVKLSGVTAYSKHRSGPKGRFAYLTLSDPIGIYETSIFNEDLITESRDLMESGNSLVALCNVRKDDGGTRLLVNELIALDEFLKNTPARDKEYQDIKMRPRRDRSDWKNKNKGNDPEYDIVALENERKKRLEDLNKKDIFDQITININQREGIFAVKSFLSQRIAPAELNKFTKIFIKTGDQKIELFDNYFIDKKDEEKINSIRGVSLS